MRNPFQYAGKELDLFSEALNWKRYFKRKLDPYVIGDVLEVGAGTGGTTRVLCPFHRGRWTCLEPDADLAAQLESQAQTFGCDVEILAGTIRELPAHRAYDCILYIDVLEHIEQDVEELEHASAHLNLNGYLVVLAPAHQWIFTEFDAAIGHFRRYDKTALKGVAPKGLDAVTLFYLDSAGLLASTANLLLLHRSIPTKRQIMFWDKFLVPVSEILDPLFGLRLGKTCVGVWRKHY